MPGYKFHILCTRPLDEFILHKAIEKSIKINIASFIKTESVDDDEVIQEIKSLETKKIVAVFTSMNAVESVIKQLHAKPDWQIFSMGGVTKDLANSFFGDASLLATAKNATTLGEKIISHTAVKEVVFFCGDQRLNELPETLAQNGVSVHELIVYKTIETPKTIEKNYDAVVFFSPSAVHSFFSVNTLPINTVIFSIGKTTTATIQSYCSNMIITSEWPGKEQMIDRVLEYFDSNKK